jgi:hypothetical protein
MVSGMATLDPAASWQSLYELLMAQLARIEADQNGLDAATVAAIREVAAWSKAQMVGLPTPEHPGEYPRC